MTVAFGSLITKNKHKYITNDILIKDKQSIDYLFQNHYENTAKLEVAEFEYKIASKNLQILTTELQTKRLRNQAKSFCKYFTL